MGKTLLSFVIPCYRSEKIVKSVIDEIAETVSQKAAQYDYEIICINDSSPDNVIGVLRKLASENPKIRVIDLAKNMGKDAAVLAGYAFVHGDYIVNLDDDYQCPMNELWRLLKPVETNECDFSTANYYKKKQSAFKNFGSDINLIMANMMLDKPANIRFENFSIFKRFIVDEIIKYDKPYPYIEGLVFRVSKRVSVIKMEERKRGDDNSTGYTLKKSFSLWLNGFTSFSVKPLRISTILGFICSLTGFIFVIITIMNKLIHPSMEAGYSSTMAVLLFIGGMIMMMLGMIGEYIGRIYICINNSPQYVIRETINCEEKDR